MTEPTTAVANSIKSRPAVLLWKASGTKTATSESVIEMMAKPISCMPLNAASIGFMPASICRWMFSRTTIASSTTIPMASTSASMVRMLMVKPKTFRTMNVEMMETGMATVGMRVERRLRRKMKMTSTTSTKAMPSGGSTC